MVAKKLVNLPIDLRETISKIVDKSHATAFFFIFLVFFLFLSLFCIIIIETSLNIDK